MLKGKSFDSVEMGMKVPLKEILYEAIKCGKWGLKPGSNQIKITGFFLSFQSSFRASHLS